MTSAVSPLTFGVGEVQTDIKIAEKLDLPVRWVADGVHVPAEVIQFPELIETPPDLVYDDLPPALTDRRADV